MSAEPSPCSESPSTRGTSLPLAGTVSRWPPSTTRRSRPSSCGRRRCADAIDGERRRARRAGAPRRGRRARPRGGSPTDRDQRGREREQIAGVDVDHGGRHRWAGHVAAPWSRRMSFSFDLSWRSPSVRRFTTSTHGRPNSPPGNVAGPGGGDGDAPVGHDAARQLFAGLGVDDRDRPGEDAAGAEHDAVADPRALGDHAAGADHASSPTMTGAACGGSSTPPMPTPPDRCTRSPICAHEPTVAQVSTIVSAPTRAPMLT